MTHRVKNLINKAIKIACIVLMLLFFVPAFTVSCSNQSVEVSPVHSIVGYYGDVDRFGEREVFSSPSPWVIILFLVPLALFILWLNFSDSIKKHLWVYIASIGGILVDFLVWGMFKSKVYSVAADNLADVQERFGYIGSMIMLIILSVLVMISAWQELILSKKEEK